MHGAYGNPDENWIPWIKEELIKRNHTVITPSFPTPEGQTFDAWSQVLNEYTFDEQTVVVGHSIAVTFLLRVLEKFDICIRGAVFVAGFLSPLHKPEFDTINETFYSDALDWNAVKSHCQSFIVLHSDNDPYVNVEQGQLIADQLGVPLRVIPDAGHFNSSSGYDQFHELLESIESVVIP